METIELNVIDGLWDRENRKAVNYNFSVLKDYVKNTENTIYKRTWEATKDANTMKMLEPVNAANELPTEVQDKSLITVIDEQRVYAYFQDEWQPFNQIDLDPFEPFKDELQTMIDNHEDKAQQLLSDMQTEHNKAVTEITGLTSDFNTDYQAKMDAFAGDYQIKSDQLLTDYNSYSGQIDTNTTNSLSDIDTAKNSALTELENFQNTDTTEWQKFKLTDEKGAYETVGLNNDIEQLHNLPNGHFYATSTPIEMATSTAGLMTVEERDTYSGLRRIEFRPYNSTQKFIKRKYDTWFDWEPEQGTKVELFNGSVSNINSDITLSAPYDMFDYLFISFNSTPGRQTKIFDAQMSDDIVISVNNVYDDASNAKAYEMAITRTNLTTLSITNEASYTFDSSGSTDSTVEIEKIVGVK
ncbi:hypothetical protein [Staphylococcus equorum]|uniref:hypothetical protein n=1 Tax=Staphylococcus equorum TaxID=246432 RepID=UPI00192D00C8|nr:hypothetical protein [Staphylococcus equorum]